MSYKDLIYSVEEKIATITLNRPERMNALSRNLEGELHRAFDEADADRAVKVIILTGSRPRLLRRAATRGARPAARAIPTRRASRTPNSSSIGSARRRKIAEWTHMWRLGKPIIAAVNGWALGAGFWYQLAADITIASDQAVFAQPEVRHISARAFCSPHCAAGRPPTAGG